MNRVCSYCRRILAASPSLVAVGEPISVDFNEEYRKGILYTHSICGECLSINFPETYKKMSQEKPEIFKGERV